MSGTVSESSSRVSACRVRFARPDPGEVGDDSANTLSVPTSAGSWYQHAGSLDLRGWPRKRKIVKGPPLGRANLESSVLRPSYMRAT